MLEKYKTLLRPYIRFKSISTDPHYIPEMKKVVEWLSDLFTKNGFKVKLFRGRRTNPIVFAEYHQADDLETVLIYGHYDVQPADEKDGWEADPFSLLEKKGRLIARGVVDNKGQNLIHIVTVFNLLKKGKLNYNVKFLIEGNEETANPDMRDIIKKHKRELKTDYVLVSDGEIIGDTPTVEASLRGGANVKVVFTTAKQNLHSGIYGGAVPNCAYELSNFLSKLCGKQNRIAIPGFYAGVDPLSKKQRKGVEHGYTKEDVLKLTGGRAIVCEHGLDFCTQVGLRPTLQISGIKTGYIGEGYANIVPCIAEARINFRFVSSQKPNEIIKAFKQFMKKTVPSYVDYTLEVEGIHNPVKINTDSEEVKRVKSLLKQAYGKTSVIKNVGGAIPFVSDVKEILGIDTLLIGLGNDDCNMHGSNENFKIDLIKKGLKFSELFFST